MDIIIKPSSLSGKTEAIGSKSDIHRLLICAAVANEKTEIDGIFFSNDVFATLSCINALGAKTVINQNSCTVYPIEKSTECPIIDCGESGSTLRFLLPVACAVTEKAEFVGKGRLPERPIGELITAMRSGGVKFSEEKLPLKTEGKLRAGKYYIPGNISSQYISGLLMALSTVEGENEIILTSKTESVGYINMTLSTLSIFGADIKEEEGRYIVKGKNRLISPKKIRVDGDWSNAAFFLAAGAIGDKIEIDGLNINSLQGDKEIIEILQRFGADIKEENGTITVSKGKLCGCRIDLSDIPDMLPALAVVAAFAEGDTVFTGAARLRLKESDRLATVHKMITDLGGKATEFEDGLTVHGTNRGLTGGKTDGANDHRIVMAAAIAAAFCKEETVITGCQAVNKSYPTFFDDMKKLGGKADVI